MNSYVKGEYVYFSHLRNSQMDFYESVLSICIKIIWEYKFGSYWEITWAQITPLYIIFLKNNIIQKN
jgi:hypothetical protein